MKVFAAIAVLTSLLVPNIHAAATEEELFVTGVNMGFAREAKNFELRNRSRNLFERMTTAGWNKFQSLPEAKMKDLAPKLDVEDLERIGRNPEINRFYSEVFLAKLNEAACGGADKPALGLALLKNRAAAAAAAPSDAASRCIQKIPVNKWKMNEIVARKFLNNAPVLADFQVDALTANAQYCAKLKLNTIITKLTTSQLQRIKGDCVAKMEDTVSLLNAPTENKIHALHKDTFTKLKKVPDNIVKFLTKDHVESFGTAADTAMFCYFLPIHQLHENAMAGVTANCLATRLMSYTLAGTQMPTLGNQSRIHRMPFDVLTKVSFALGKSINSGDWQNFTAIQLSKLPSAACGAIPSFTERFPFKPSPECYVQLKPENQLLVLTTGNYEDKALEGLSAAMVRKWSNGIDNFSSANKVRASALQHLGQAVNISDSPCTLFRDQEQFMDDTFASFRKNLSSNCLAALVFLGDMTPQQLQNINDLAYAGFTPERIAALKGADYLAKATDTFIGAMARRSDFYKTISHTDYVTIRDRLGPKMTESAAKEITFVKEMSQQDYAPIAPVFFRAVDFNIAQQIQNPAWLDPAQIGELGASVPDAQNPGKAITPTALIGFSDAQRAAFNGHLFANLPIETHKAMTGKLITTFKPPAVQFVTATILRNWTDDTWKHLSEEQLASLGKQVPRESPDHVRHAVDKKRLSMLSKKKRKIVRVEVLGESAAEKAFIQSLITLAASIAFFMVGLSILA